MAIQNFILVLENLCAVNTVKQGRDAVAGVLGQSMPEALSQGRSTSPGFATFEPTLKAKAKRVGRSAANLPGKTVRSRFWQLPNTWATYAEVRHPGFDIVTGRAGSDHLVGHQLHSGHDYPSHDRRDDLFTRSFGSAFATSTGK